MRGTSTQLGLRYGYAWNFYPRSPCGERHNRYRLSAWICRRFLSTFPLRGTSVTVRPPGTNRRISIHVPLAGNVFMLLSHSSWSGISIHVPLAGNVYHLPGPEPWHAHFYPRSPCGERHHIDLICDITGTRFLSTFPLRGTSTARSPRSARSADFYPRSPCGERRMTYLDVAVSVKFLSTFPLRGTSGLSMPHCSSSLYFYPRSPCGERPGIAEPPTR